MKFYLKTVSTQQYMRRAVSEVRKSFLTKEQEEDLIRRLYICNKLDIFTPTIYEVSRVEAVIWYCMDS